MVVLEVGEICGEIVIIIMFENSLVNPCAERCMPSFTIAPLSHDPSPYVKLRSLLTNVASFSSHVAGVISFAFSHRSLFLLSIVGRKNTADIHRVRGGLGSVNETTESEVNFVECSRPGVNFSAAHDDDDIRDLRVGIQHVGEVSNGRSRFNLDDKTSYHARMKPF